MQIIKELSKQIDSEIEDAENYAKEALKYKDDNKPLAGVFYDLSVAELNHATMLHGQVVRMIEEYKKAKGEPPADMLAVYKYIHEQEIEKTQRVKNYQQMFRE